MSELYELSNAVLLSTTDYDEMEEAFDLEMAITVSAEESFQKGNDASKSYVSSLPAVVVSASVEPDDMTCSVCMDSFNLKIGSTVTVSDNAEEQCVKQVPCGHIYHADCIATWLSRRNTCPLCRCKILMN